MTNRRDCVGEPAEPFLERLAGQLVYTVMQIYADSFEHEVIQNRIRCWQTDPFLAELIALDQQEDKVNPISSGWITLGQRKRERQEVAR